MRDSLAINGKESKGCHARSGRARESGSALVLALFTMVLLTAMGSTLLFVTEVEMKSTKVDHEAKRAYFVSEAGLEDGRETVRAMNVVSTNKISLDDELTWAAGLNGTIDFDVNAVAPIFNGAGAVTGLVGQGDDQFRGPIYFGQGTYAAFLTNDPFDGITNLDDTNDRVMITGLGVGDDQSVEVVQAIVERFSMPNLPATITVLGPDSDMSGGTSPDKEYKGDDCDYGVNTLSVPVVGMMGSTSLANAHASIVIDLDDGTQVEDTVTYTTDGGATVGVDTVVDIDGVIEPEWTDCDYLIEMSKRMRDIADIVGDSNTDYNTFGTPSDPKIVYIEGDYSFPPGGSLDFGGVLWVTGILDLRGNIGWFGSVYAVGKGELIRSGGGNGSISGAVFVADVAGPDGIMYTTDDCSGNDGNHGTSDDGIANSSYLNTGGGNGDIQYCDRAIKSALITAPLRVVDFLQH